MDGLTVLLPGWSPACEPRWARTSAPAAGRGRCPRSVSSSACCPPWALLSWRCCAGGSVPATASPSRRCWSASGWSPRVCCRWSRSPRPGGCSPRAAGEHGPGLSRPGRTWPRRRASACPGRVPGRLHRRRGLLGWPAAGGPGGAAAGDDPAVRRHVRRRAGAAGAAPWPGLAVQVLLAAAAGTDRAHRGRAAGSSGHLWIGVTGGVPRDPRAAAGRGAPSREAVRRSWPSPARRPGGPGRPGRPSRSAAAPSRPRLAGSRAPPRRPTRRPARRAPGPARRPRLPAPAAPGRPVTRPPPAAAPTPAAPGRRRDPVPPGSS